MIYKKNCKRLLIIRLLNQKPLILQRTKTNRVMKVLEVLDRTRLGEVNEGYFSNMVDLECIVDVDNIEYDLKIYATVTGCLVVENSRDLPHTSEMEDVNIEVNEVIITQGEDQHVIIMSMTDLKWDDLENAISENCL